MAREGNRTDRKVVARVELVYWKWNWPHAPPFIFPVFEAFDAGDCWLERHRREKHDPSSLNGGACKPCQHIAGTDSCQHSVVCWHCTRSQWFSVSIARQRLAKYHETISFRGAQSNAISTVAISTTLSIYIYIYKKKIFFCLCSVRRREELGIIPDNRISVASPIENILLAHLLRTPPPEYKGKCDYVRVSFGGKDWWWCSQLCSEVLETDPKTSQQPSHSGSPNLIRFIYIRTVFFPSIIFAEHQSPVAGATIDRTLRLDSAFIFIRSMRGTLPVRPSISVVSLTVSESVIWCDFVWWDESIARQGKYNACDTHTHIYRRFLSNVSRQQF